MNTTKLPWSPPTVPLMLAPMQGLTNRALRRVFIDWVRPDVVFTEFIRVSPAQRRPPVSDVDETEALDGAGEAPVVVQIIAADHDRMVDAARRLDERGVQHININMGCPYGRMTGQLSGGGMLKAPEHLDELLLRLREVVGGSLSVKTRAGFDDEEQVFTLVEAFEAAAVDFLVIHPRTVVEKFDGHADHEITARLVAATTIPVIANGDIATAAQAHQVLEETGAAGLMLGRGALGDPMLFERIRGRASPKPSSSERADEIRYFLPRLVEGYQHLYCGDAQVLSKLKGSLAYFDVPDINRWLTALRRAQKLSVFAELALRGP
ncbi:MAG: dihydrouridine synthase [Deltaproteobacteria bacterium RIFOXYA12_FULL_58_15]|nr:MAG: dihydrouridine synthase [Deltaproteobacteria bacterium RIFOXYA12_FULL_58_15]OGR12434.1 MAG: dihydrouridine synthase [Deltaproteobacteria bacterium RIFOXYB12_FULL_58_9]